MSNTFGGKNHQSEYIPLTEVEQEFLHRLVDSGSLVVDIIGWGVVQNPKVMVGDSQIIVPMDITFDRPETPIPVDYFDLELKTNSGFVLYKERQSTRYGNQPLMVSAGYGISMIWHVGITCINPDVIRMIMPGVVGLTSRVFDKDTGNITLTGNMKLDSRQKALARIVRKGEAKARAVRRSKLG